MTAAGERYDALPGTPFPGDPNRCPTRDEVVAYLTDYARELPVEYGSRVTGLSPAAAGYRVELTDRVLEAGQVVDLLLDVTHPGRWMARCHIAEHHESGMRFRFTVDP